MGTKTKIEWTDATWNPVRGCSIVSEGCQHCYAMRQAHRQNKPGKAYEGLTRVGAHGPTWTGDVRFVPEALDYPLKLRKPHRIFVNSMSDLFHEKVTDHQIAKIFGVMMATPHHTYQILTKRPERARQWFGWIAGSKHLTARELCEELALPDVEACHLQALDRDDWPLLNVWLGTSVEDQQTAEERIPWLLETPAAKHWISAEPLLGPIDLTQLTLGYFKNERHGSDFVSARRLHNAAATPSAVINALTGAALGRVEFDEKLCLTGDGVQPLDWVVVGGESGPGARPMHPDWVRSLRDQCAAAGVPFFFKQWGEYLPTREWSGCSHPSSDGAQGPVVNLNPQRVDIYRCNLCSALHDCHGIEVFQCLGKKAAGNTLDGRQHLEYPA